jgi:ABC-type sugar transport system permease subunit
MPIPAPGGRVTRTHNALAALVFVAPALAGLVAFVVIPFALAAVWLSTHRVNLANPNAQKKFSIK